ncbi:altronate dehydratase family protein [Pendulispora brunnea]|uniref:Altronate dehydratase family protein n=1 Tax=Pendulispora brunnea TaxID=2905690 RepID=A0ABZ2KMK5_9BACT
MSSSPLLKLHPRDDVLIAKVRLPAGTMVETEEGPVPLAQTIGAGHKVAYRARAIGEPVHRYGQVIGQCTAPIHPAEHVHVHNLRAVAFPRGERPAEPSRNTTTHAALEPTRFFEGYLRPDGRVGTRNYVAVLSTVNCSATVSHLVRDHFREVQRDFPNVDGVIALTHKSGCGLVSGGDDHATLERVLAGYAHHPNIAAYVVIGLGCEVAQASPMAQRHRLSLLDSGRAPPIIGIQQHGGARKAVAAAIEAIAQLLPLANFARRTTRPASDLILATNCGGSDGYSGITANPALGAAVDELVRLGGTGVLSETTEIFGAEHLLMARAESEAIARKLQERVDWWKTYLAMHNADVGSNPSPGNMAGGITTIAEKSLGGIAKGGTTPLVDVLEYAERITKKGFVYMDTPGYDPVSVTGLVAGGANMVCFTTGRGSVFGSKPVPSLKLASNSALYRHMEDDMDIDCGVVLDGTPVEEVGRRILDEVLAVASGKKTKSELAGMGEAEFAPWMRGPTL